MVRMLDMSLSLEEQQAQQRGQSRARLRNLIITFAVLITIRLVVKNPAPPKTPDHSNAPIEIVPGMLDAIPLSALSKMDPRLIEKMKKVDYEAKHPKEAPGFYTPANEPLGIKEAAIIRQEYVLTESKRRRINKEREEMEQPDPSKTTVVLFKNGGHLKTQKSLVQGDTLDIRFDKTIRAQMPATLVHTIEENALNWQEPVPRGQVRIKPAKGITLTLGKDMAKRISLPVHTPDGF
jgi:hypothetical protein